MKITTWKFFLSLTTLSFFVLFFWACEYCEFFFFFSSPFFSSLSSFLFLLFWIGSRECDGIKGFGVVNKGGSERKVFVIGDDDTNCWAIEGKEFGDESECNSGINCGLNGCKPIIK